jgi:hypothetical protein
MTSLAAEFQQARQAQLKAQRERWVELRHAAVQVSLEIDGSKLTEKTHDRLTEAILATHGGWLV